MMAMPPPGFGQGPLPQGQILTLMPDGSLVPMPNMTGQIVGKDPESLKPSPAVEQNQQAVSEVLLRHDRVDEAPVPRPLLVRAPNPPPPVRISDSSLPCAARSRAWAGDQSHGHGPASFQLQVEGVVS